MNLTLKAKSPGSHYELPLIRQLADGSVPELQNLRLGCELAFVSPNLRPCPGRVAHQASDTNYTCSIDLRDCSGQRLGAGENQPAQEEAYLLFTLVSTAGAGPVSASELLRSPALSLRRQLRLLAPEDGRFLLPTGLATGGTLSFGAYGLRHLVAGRSFCRIEDSLRRRVAELAILEASEEQAACTFTSEQLERLSAEGSETDQFKLLLSNNIDPAVAYGVGPETDHDGLQNWFDPELEVDIFDSPFFKGDAVVDWIEPRAVFHNKNSSIEVKASSRLTRKTAKYERYADLAPECGLYDLAISSLSARMTAPCSFASTRLDTIVLRLEAQVLKRGTYHIRVGLAGQGPSLVLESKPLRVLYAPRLDSVYPRHVSLEGFLEDYGAIRLIGYGFQGLTEVEGTLRCLLVAETNGSVSATFLAS